jgi:hypothetical protein
MSEEIFNKKPSRPRQLTETVLKKALSQAGHSKTALSRALGLRVATVCLWYRGIQPAEKNLVKLEEFVAENTTIESAG